MAELNAQQKHLVSNIDKYQNLIRGIAEKIQDYIYSWKTTPREELPHFYSWPEPISQEQSHWIVSDFIAALIYANVPEKVITAVKEANNILLGFRELNGFDEHLNYGNLDEKKIAPLYCVRDLLSEFIDRDLAGKQKKSTGRKQKYSDDIIKRAMGLHDDEYAKSKDDKAAWNKTADTYEFQNGEAARRTVTRRMKKLLSKRA